MINKCLSYNNKSLSLKKKKLIKKKNYTLIRIRSCGICGSDIKIIKGQNRRVKNGTIIGHEISGEICKFINRKIILTKKKIFLGADIPNKNKKDLALGHEIDGGFQKYLYLKNSLLKTIPHKITNKKIDFDEASMCEPLACVLKGFEKINYKKGSDIIIFGNGSIGNLIASVGLYFRSKRIVVVDISTRRICKGIQSKFLKRFTLNNLKKKKIKRFSYGFVACNSFEAQNEILNFMIPSGKINYFSGISYNTKLPKINTNLIHYKELSIVGSHGSDKKHIIKAANLIIDKKLNLNHIISHKFPLDSYKKAFNVQIKKDGLKIIINP